MRASYSRLWAATIRTTARTCPPLAERRRYSASCSFSSADSASSRAIASIDSIFSAKSSLMFSFARTQHLQHRPARLPSREHSRAEVVDQRTPASHVGDQVLHALVHGFERVLAQDRPLGLVVQLEVHPIHG